MRTVRGTCNEAVIYAETFDENAEAQIREMCSLPFLAREKIRIMPDVHAGKGCTIGTTMTIHDACVPSFVGVDIGCGMEVIRLEEQEADFAKLDRLIHAQIPAGFNIRTQAHENISHLRLDELYCREAIDMDRALRSIGTLGGGNHFIEVDRDEEGTLWLVIHSGSRHAGVGTCSYYTQRAADSSRGFLEGDIGRLIREYKEAGRTSEIQAAILAYRKERAAVSTADAYCTGDVLKAYIHDMKIMQEYAVWNRKTMAQIILEGMGWHAAESFCTIHNYIDTENMILRKGAVSAMAGEKLIIPINMKDGSLICIGKGNEEWNCSAPHGAGRICSRAQAKRNFSMAEYEAQMRGIYTTSVNIHTIDEAPMAYKKMEEIMACITDTCEVISIIRPVYNFKAGEE